MDASNMDGDLLGLMTSTVCPILCYNVMSLHRNGMPNWKCLCPGISLMGVFYPIHLRIPSESLHGTIRFVIFRIRVNVVLYVLRCSGVARGG